ncbi:hypothetical protein DCAR_0207216 [Daucus carota subsp. sativus]|uniref:NB-ARC domain-containing protein n=3 Tax=Daucus carota subsp. sativus TaxID=79200 RepID=A0AAF0WGX2_DAUCS|nr:hypothetical protein DCAR_0207216 [Daucus carota subsp. sativus]
MAGVGKTTLAKALYNQLLLGGSFKESCFLVNCREVCQTTQGLASLQQKLLNDILTSKNPVKVDNVDKGIKWIRARLLYTKVLVAIDDLDHRKQFEYLVGPFASGSVVIITTRDEEMLDKIGVEPRYRYRVYELDDDKSLTLFNHHAFGNAVPNSSFMVMTKEILGRAGGLPLALEVFGSYLYTRPEVGWKSFVKKLQQIPDSTIQQRLLICLDALESDDPMLKEIFLDIACFLVGLGMRSVVELLKTYYSDVDYKIGILKKRCLLTVDDSNKLRMHDLLLDMGRDVSRNNSPKQPEKHSRLWAVEDIHDVLKKHKGTEVIECIIPCDIEQGDSLNRVPFKISTETFKRMVNLRFLFLTDVDIIGSFEQTFEDLRWLLWDECPLTEFPSDFYPQKLVSLALPESKMRTMWGLNKVFENLKDLDMSHSCDLTATPDFTRLPCLETLKLMNCKSLEEVHISVGTLGKLVCLSLPGCVKLKRLPHTLCNLSALKVLDINICESLEALPVELGNIKSLEEFIASGLSSVSILPDSIGRLSNLVMLSLRENGNLETLPDTICNLSALKVLNIDNCTGLRALPKELGKMESLKHLSMSGLNLSEIPNSIGNLHELVVLLLSDNENLRNLPHSICSLRSLEALYISGCKKLDILPENFGDLTKSEELYDEYAWIKYCESGYYSNYFKPMPLFYAGMRELYSETEPCCIII